MATATVTVDEQLLRRAKEIAAARGMSVEAYVDRLLRVVTQPPPKENELGPITRGMLGILPPMTSEEAEQIVDSKLPPVTRSALGLFKDIPDKSKELLTGDLVKKQGLPE